jgi:hypothetical protein
MGGAILDSSEDWPLFRPRFGRRKEKRTDGRSESFRHQMLAGIARAGGVRKQNAFAVQSKGYSLADAARRPRVAPAQPTPSTPKETGAGASRPDDLEWEPAPALAQPAPAPTAARRSAFGVRPDTRDL